MPCSCGYLLTLVSALCIIAAHISSSAHLLCSVSVKHTYLHCQCTSLILHCKKKLKALHLSPSMKVPPREIFEVNRESTNLLPNMLLHGASSALAEIRWPSQAEAVLGTVHLTPYKRLHGNVWGPSHTAAIRICSNANPIASVRHHKPLNNRTYCHTCGSP